MELVKIIKKNKTNNRIKNNTEIKSVNTENKTDNKNKYQGNFKNKK